MNDRAPASPAGSAPAVMSDDARGGREGGPKGGPAPLRRIAAAYGAALLAGGLVVGLAAGVVSAATAPMGTVTAQAVTESGRGGQLFLTSCAACHGTQGAGTANGPDIRNAGAALADFMLRTGRMPLGTSGAPARRGTPYFSDADRQAIVAYVASLGTGPGIPNVVTSNADVNAGRDIYTANCAACHGPAGGGGSVGGGFVAPALNQADATTIGEAAVSGPGPMPRFGFTPSQLDNLAAYVGFLRDAPHPGGATSPEVGPVTEGFIAGVALLVLLLVARWVAVRQVNDGEGALAAAGDGGDGGDGNAASAVPPRTPASSADPTDDAPDAPGRPEVRP